MDGTKSNVSAASTNPMVRSNSRADSECEKKRRTRAPYKKKRAGQGALRNRDQILFSVSAYGMLARAQR